MARELSVCVAPMVRKSHPVRPVAVSSPLSFPRASVAVVRTCLSAATHRAFLPDAVRGAAIGGSATELGWSGEAAQIRRPTAQSAFQGLAHLDVSSGTTDIAPALKGKLAPGSAAHTGAWHSVVRLPLVKLTAAFVSDPADTKPAEAQPVVPDLAPPLAGAPGEMTPVALPPPVVSSTPEFHAAIRLPEGSGLRLEGSLQVAPAEPEAVPLAEAEPVVPPLAGPMLAGVPLEQAARGPEIARTSRTPAWELFVWPAAPSPVVEMTLPRAGCHAAAPGLHGGVRWVLSKTVVWELAVRLPAVGRLKHEAPKIELPPEEPEKPPSKPALEAFLEFWHGLPQIARLGAMAAVGVVALMILVLGSVGGKIGQAVRDRAAILYAEDFQGDLTAWQGAANWAINQTGSVRVGGLGLWKPSLPMKDYQFELLGLIHKGGIGWAVRAADADNYYAMKLVTVKQGRTPALALIRYAVIGGKEFDRIQSPLTIVAQKDAPQKIRCDVAGANFALTIDDQFVASWQENRLRSGGVGVFTGKNESADLYLARITYQNDSTGRFCARLASNFRGSK